MKNISNQAVIHKNAVIGENVTISPFAIIEENVKIGDNTFIGPYVHISGWTDIGKSNKILTGAAIGGEPQDFHYKGDKSYVIIGDNNIIHEFVTIHRGTEKDTKTVIGNNNMFMAYSHAGHNVIVHNNVILVNSVSLGGYVEVFDKAFISAASQIHQFCKIGKLVMVAPLSKVAKDVPPFMLVQGAETAVVKSLNIVGLRRDENISSDDFEKIKKFYTILYRSNLNTKQALEKIKLEKELVENIHIKEMIEFISNASRGICGHFKK